MRGNVTDITIIGGGDSGLLTALCIQKLNPEIDISVVDDFRQDIPQVGKSTFWKILEVLHEKLDIGQDRFVSEVKPIWKCSVYFRDWCGYEPFHFPFDEAVKYPSVDTPNAIEYYYYHYDEIFNSPDHRTKNEEIVEQGKSPWYFDPSDFGYHKYEPIAYHLDTRRFNSFLRDVCRDRGISLINDEIIGVDADGTHIRRVKSKSQNYVSDLYIDATGFNRVLKRELESDFRSFDFPLDSAFNTRVDRPLQDVIPATIVDSGDHGWFWHIDTYDNRDLGYVYASEYVSHDDARQDFLAHIDADVSPADLATYEFSSGYYDRAWDGNCLAIGNAEGFVEPLQSTGLTINALAAVSLSNLLSAHGGIADDGIRETYNSWVRRSWESIYDFIAIHYRYADGDTDFWKAIQSIPVSDRVTVIERAFDANGFDTNVASPTTNTAGIDDLIVFHPENFYTLMRNMGATSDFYETNEFHVRDSVKQAHDDYYQKIQEDVEDHLTAKEFYKGIIGEEGLIPGS